MKDLAELFSGGKLASTDKQIALKEIDKLFSHFLGKLHGCELFFLLFFRLFFIIFLLMDLF